LKAKLSLLAIGIASLALSASALGAIRPPGSSNVSDRSLAGRKLAVGVNDDAVKWRPGISAIANDLGLGYYRVTQAWQPGQRQLTESDAVSLA
jgi:hypothetical protein